jgi:hypothetical protein
MIFLVAGGWLVVGGWWLVAGGWLALHKNKVVLYLS